MTPPSCPWLVPLSFVVIAYALPAIGDPFDPQRLISGKNLPARPPQDLGFYEPSQLILVGTLSQGGARQALLQDPQRRVYRVASGRLIGHTGWRVVHVGETRVTLAPPSSDASGAAHPVHLSLEQP
ncbi:MAG: pilus assembly protein PilP [Paludibacterium sp.]|uniref:pilus assembly protein PilP n=1 Tax=Paludibacterium sp. TaxID=1917523 RepID=UPI0025FF84B5|nr:pilus assembly protein PilP [Paludibacterium sp.]MBV8046673.1 pilus assembly protein PilP [Paludibacterium sp.]MBV8649584.1 pilus assembly protein PilP [Paludibacterium sp.]